MTDGDINPLFRDRTANAAAIQLATTIAWLAECELATLEHYRARRSAPQGERQRHESICATLVYHLQDLGVRPVGLFGRPCPRLEEELKTPKEVLVERMRIYEKR